MTTYEVTSDASGHNLVASWPDLPERANHPVATFQELKLATVAKSVLNAASRYRWCRWIQLLDEGTFTEKMAGPDPTAVQQPTIAQPAPDSGATSDQVPRLPRLPTSAVLGDSPMSEYLQARIEGLLQDPGETAEPVGPSPTAFGSGTFDLSCGGTGAATSRPTSMTAWLPSSTRKSLRRQVC
jgi:hypothetical protein